MKTYAPILENILIFTKHYTRINLIVIQIVNIFTSQTCNL